MDDGTITIRIAGALDRSVEASFNQAGRMAERTGQQAAKALGGGQTDRLGALAASRAKILEKSLADQVKAIEKASGDEIRLAKKVADTKERLAGQTARAAERAARQETRDAAREIEARIKDEEKAAKKIEDSRSKFAKRAAHRATNLVFGRHGALGMAGSVVGDLARGAGVDFSVAGMMGRAVSNQALAMNLSNQGYLPQEKGPNGLRVSSKLIEGEARATAQATGYSTEAILKGQTKFVDITGDMAGARAAMPNIAKLAGASNTDPEKMAEAWANVSRHVGEVPNKAEKVYGLMKLIAGQGRLGSDEIKYMAPQLSKITAAADRYASKDKVKIIGELTAISQMAKAEGGAASSSQAATSVARFTDLFATPARAKAMLRGGLKEEDLYGHDAKGNRTGIKDPLEIIRKGLTATGGDIIKMGSMFKSVMASRAVNSLTTAYNDAGGGKAGMDAVNKEFAKYGKEAAFSDDQIAENNKERMDSPATQALVFQEKLDEIGRNVEAQLLPALQQLAPIALQAATGLGSIITWASKNPMEALGVAVSGAILQATIETAFRTGIEKMMTGALAGSIAPVAITIGVATLVMHLIDNDVADQEKKQGNDALNAANMGAAEGENDRADRHGVYTKENQKSDEDIENALKEKLDRVDKLKGNEYGVYNPKASDLELAGERFANPEKADARHDAEHEGELRRELAEVHERLEAIRTGTLKVTVTNAAEIAASGGPKIYRPGMSPDPNHPPGPWR
jgi:hypothetical protein